ncbi:MAG TPA: GAF domain-containing protein, partial [Dehalococcoidia bacterium]|nr:GAF domain-containing protein [Dehalococcoidia bacterium]
MAIESVTEGARWAALGDRVSGRLAAGGDPSETLAAVARDLAGVVQGICAVYQSVGPEWTPRRVAYEWARPGEPLAPLPPDLPLADGMPPFDRAWYRPIRLGSQTLGWLAFRSADEDATLDRAADIVCPLLALYLGQHTAITTPPPREHRNLLAEAIHLFNEVQRPEPVLEFILQRVTEMLDGDRGVLRLLNEGRDRLDLGAIYAKDPESLADLQSHIASRIPLGERVAGRVAMSGEPMIVTGPAAPSLSTTLLGTNSLLSLPLRNSQSVVGTLTVGFTGSQPFPPERLEAARNLANLAALVLENARHHAKTQRHAREAIALFEVARALTSTMSVQEILRQITRRAAELLDVQYCLYCRHDAAGDQLIGEIGHGVSDEEVTVRMPISPLAAEAMATRRAVFAADAQSDPRVNQRLVRRFGIKSVLCAPLLIKDRFIGVIYFYDKERHRVFEQDELDLITSFTNYAVVAIENSNLHEGLQRTLDQLLVLYQAGRDISSSLELESVVEAVTRSLAHLFRADYYVVSELAEDGSTIRLLASRGVDPAYLDRRGQAAVLEPLRWVLESPPLSATVVGPLAVPEVDGDALAGYLQIVPLRARGRVVAAIEIFSATSPPAEENHDLLLAIGVAAGAAIEHAKLYAVVRDQQRQLQSLVEALITAQEEERRRIAYDVHDGLAQIIVSADQYLQAYQELHRQGAPQAGATLDRGLHFLSRAIAESRRVISHLRPPGLDDHGLVPALEEYLGELRAETGWRIELIDRIGGQVLSPAVETTVYRIVQEALANARKYAQPDRIRVALSVQDGQLTVDVRDWGKGFDPSQVDRTGRSGRRVGLVGMQERARLIGGVCHVTSAPHQGTRIRVTIPLAATVACARADRP